MSAKSLQKPVITQIIGSTIRVAHPDISGYTRTYLSAQIAAAGTAMTVQDNTGFSDDDWFVVGEPGDQETEENDVNGAVTKGTALTVTNALSFAHELTAPVTRIYERGIKIYGGTLAEVTADPPTGHLIASIDAKTASGRQLADAVMIEWNKLYTEYTLISTDTAYAYYYAVFTDGTTSSSASDYVASTGLTSSSVEYFIQQALTLTGSRIDGELLKREDLVKTANDCQTAIQQFKYQDPVTGRLTQMNWDFEVTENKTSLTISTGEHEYALSSLTSAPKFDSDRAIISVRIGSEGKIDKQTIAEYDEDTEAFTRSDANGGAAIGATSLVVDSNVEFDASGTLYSGANTITYTAKSGTTTFTGIPASGTGSITATISDNAPVWQGIQLDLPTKYTIFDGKLIFDLPPSSDYNNYPIKIRHFKKLTVLTEASDTTEVSFTNVFQLYLASWIERRKGNEDKAIQYMTEFNNQLLNNALASNVPTIDETTYYKFVDD